MSIRKVDWPREAFWLYGVVDPVSGWDWSQTHSHLNQTQFQHLLDHLSRARHGGGHAARPGSRLSGQGDSMASKHHSPLSTSPLSRTQPHRTFWQHLKATWKGENFPSLVALQQRVDEELARLTPEQVQSITGYDFILDALLQAEFHKAA